MTRKQSPEFVLVIRATPAGEDKHGRDPLYRLRGVLKTMLRRFGWRCVSCRPRLLDERDAEPKTGRAGQHSVRLDRTMKLKAPACPE